MKRIMNSTKIAKMFSVSQARGMEAVIKAQLISAVMKQVEKDGVTHAQLAARSGLPRSAVTGILSGSVQKVTIDRVLKMVEAAGLVADVRVRKAA
jgi:predicted XRE-type DNA-binding protein